MQLAKNLLIFSRQDQGPDSQFVTLDNPEWQDGIVKIAEGFDCLIFDNFSTLSEVEDENSASQVRGVNDLLLKLKQMSKSAILVHHANKSKTPGDGGYRGSSNLAVVLNLIVRLEKDPNADLGDSQGARFSVVFEKTRAKLNQAPVALKLDAAPFLEGSRGDVQPLKWAIDEESGNTVDRFVRHVKSGRYVSLKEIAEAMGCHWNTVGSTKKIAFAQGALTPKEYDECIKRARMAKQAPKEAEEGEEDGEAVEVPF